MAKKIQWTNDKRKLGDLVPWPRNPRQIKKDEAKRLSDSLHKFDQVETIAIGPDSEIYNGHQRLNVWIEEYGPDFEVDVRISSRALTEKEREKLTVYLHKGAAGEWNFDILANEFEVEDLIDWGFSEKELQIEGFDFGEDGDAPEPQIDKAEELQKKWKVERGQIWEIGRHRLMCGDSTSEEDVGLLLNRQTPNLMITDPPYGVDYDPLFRERALGAAVRRTGKVQSDDVKSWQVAFNLFSGDVVYVWRADKNAVSIGLDLINCGFEIKGAVIWKKIHSPFGQGHYTFDHEACWYAIRKSGKSHWIKDGKDSSVWEITLNEDHGGHGTQKPIECMSRPMKNHSGDVYDPFIGSGTTMVAAEQLNRMCYGMEIEPKYCAVALERMSDMGLKPKLVKNG